MACPPISDLEEYASGRLSVTDSCVIQSHLAHCTVCERQLDEITENIRFIARLRSARPRKTGESIDQDSVASEQPVPESLGAYRVTGEIGRGGMGVVYEAVQQDPNRPVALKLINFAHADDPSYLRLFQRETQALGRLNHPGIASIYEAGTAPDGRPFIAMELVRGQPITEFAQQSSLSESQKLDLFYRVCDAIAFAHQRGVIHRDLKPSNILIREDRSPKILDFGLAKILSENPADASLVTQAGKVFGTLPYMSPEHTRGNPAAVDTRSDVYSLGVILYQLLTTEFPYDIDSTHVPASIRSICEQPPRRLSPKRGARSDLETIVLKALEKDPQDRYQSVADFRDDLNRYVRNEPIVARAPSVVYLLKKFAARNRALAATGATLLLVLLVGSGVATWQAVRATKAEKLAQTRLARSELEAAKFKAINDFLQDMLSSVNPEDAPGQLDVGMQAVLESAVNELDQGALRNRPEIELAVRTTLGNTYRSLGDFANAEVQLEQAVSIGRSLYPGGHEDLAFSIHKYARMLLEAGDYSRAEPLMRESLAMRRRLLGDGHLDVAKSLNNLGVLLWRRGEIDQAESMLRDVLTRQRRIHGQQHVEVATALNNLALILYERDTSEALREAESLLELSLQMDRSLRGSDHPNITATMNNLATVYVDRGKPEQAAALLEEVIQLHQRLLGDEHVLVALAVMNLGNAVLTQGNRDDAVLHFQNALSMYRRLQAQDHPDYARTAWKLAQIYSDTGMPEEALPLYEEAYRVFSRQLGPNNIGTLAAADQVGNTLADLERLQEADVFLARAIGAASAASQPNLHRIARLQITRGRCLALLNRTGEAEQLLVPALSILEENQGHYPAEELTAARRLLDSIRSGGKR